MHTQALAEALKSFSGGVLVVSHDQHFINSVCNEVWVVGDQKVVRFEGDCDDYRKLTVKKIKASKKR